MLEDKNSLFNQYTSLVKPSIVNAIVMTDTSLKKSNETDAISVAILTSGEIVTILQDRGYQWYQIKRSNGTQGWVAKGVLWIQPDEPVNTSMLTKAQIEGYLNWKNIGSDTEYLIWVDIDRQMTYIVKKDRESGSWKLFKKMLCSTGKNVSPTKRGIYKIQDRGEWFYSEVFNSGAMYWVRYCESYLFHSIAMNNERLVIEDTLGKKASAGCIRMTIEDSEWFYNHMPEGTAVYIY